MSTTSKNIFPPVQLIGRFLFIRFRANNSELIRGYDYYTTHEDPIIKAKALQGVIFFIKKTILEKYT